MYPNNNFNYNRIFNFNNTNQDFLKFYYSLTQNPYQLQKLYYSMYFMNQNFMFNPNTYMPYNYYNAYYQSTSGTPVQKNQKQNVTKKNVEAELESENSKIQLGQLIWGENKKVQLKKQKNKDEQSINKGKDQRKIINQTSSKLQKKRIVKQANQKRNKEIKKKQVLIILRDCQPQRKAIQYSGRKKFYNKTQIFQQRFKIKKIRKNKTSVLQKISEEISQNQKTIQKLSKFKKIITRNSNSNLQLQSKIQPKIRVQQKYQALIPLIKPQPQKKLVDLNYNQNFNYKLMCRKKWDSQLCIIQQLDNQMIKLIGLQQQKNFLNFLCKMECPYMNLMMQFDDKENADNFRITRSFSKKK